MSRVIVINDCVDCQYRGALWCDLQRKRLEVVDTYTPFPAWCPLPESGEKEESDGRVR